MSETTKRVILAELEALFSRPTDAWTPEELANIRKGALLASRAAIRMTARRCADVALTVCAYGARSAIQTEFPEAFRKREEAPDA